MKADRSRAGVTCRIRAVLDQWEGLALRGHKERIRLHYERDGAGTWEAQDHTSGEWIRTMTTAELAEFLHMVGAHGVQDFPQNADLYDELAAYVDALSR